MNKKLQINFQNLLSQKKKIKLIGKARINNKDRAPTISFTLDGISSKRFSDELIKQNIALRNDNFYAWRCLKALGIDTEDGVVRVSMVHYNNLDDVNRLIDAIKKTSIFI